MKEIKVNMTKKFLRLSTRAIRSKAQIIELLLETIPLLQYSEVVERPEENYILLRIDRMKRLFFVIENKIFSFNFPFSIDFGENGDTLRIYDSSTDIEISGLNYVTLTTAFKEIFMKNEDYGVTDLDSEIMSILEKFDQEPNKDSIWQILKSLLTFEAGYLRYDYDEERENGDLHPLNHIDVNYSSGGTFKLGIKSSIVCTDFVDIVNVNTNSFYISK